jgi:hypothetical protein
MYNKYPWEGLPSSIRPFRPTEEVQLMTPIIEKRREKLAVDLDQSPNIDRWPAKEEVQDSDKRRVLVVGSSHAIRWN